MGKIIEKYIIVADGEIIKSYKTFKEAMWDMDFFSVNVSRSLHLSTSS